MSKRQRSESPRIDLDEKLRPYKQHRPRTPTTTNDEKIDHENEMDNWYISSRDSEKQKDSTDRLERGAWDSRHRLDPSEISDKAAGWHYFQDGNNYRREWVANVVAPSPMKRITRRTRSLNLQGGPNRSFQANHGDKEISALYWKYWMENDKEKFISVIYQKYAEGEWIPEKTLWEIFRCLVQELVPQDEMWKTIPVHIISQPNTIWQVGKCMVNIITRGHYWDDVSNVLKCVHNGVRFGIYKKDTLQSKFHANYSKNLMKYILGCLSVRELDRFTRSQLLDHFEEVFSVYDDTYVKPIVGSTADAPYEPKERYRKLIPRQLTNEEGLVYETLINIAESRATVGTGTQVPHIIVVTDLAKDYDDLMAMMCLKELQRLGIVKLEGFVANLMPADKRALFGRGALDSLNLTEITCAKGTIGDPNRKLDEQSHEFDGTQDFMKSPTSENMAEANLPDGQELLVKVFRKAIDENYKLTLLGISSLMDIAEFARDHEDLLEQGLGNVVLQGGYRMIDGKLTADPAAANNKFDMDSSNYFHAFMEKHKIPSTVWTKVATEAVSIYNTLFEFLEQTGHPLGPYIRQVQVNQDLNFYAHACDGPLFAPHMTQEWYVKTKSTWFSAGHEPDEEYPRGKAMIPYFTKVVAYDALAAVGSAGEDVLDEFGIIKPFTSRPDAKHPTHRLIGVPKIAAKDDQPALPQDQNLDGDKMGVVITALMKGSILAVQQKLEDFRFS